MAMLTTHATAWATRPALAAHVRPLSCHELVPARQTVYWDDEEGRVEKKVMGRIVPGAILYMTSYARDVFFATEGRLNTAGSPVGVVWRYCRVH